MNRRTGWVRRAFARIHDLLLREPSFPEYEGECEEDRILPSGKVIRRGVGTCPFYDQEGPSPRCSSSCHRRVGDDFTCDYYDAGGR